MYPEGNTKPSYTTTGIIGNATTFSIDASLMKDNPISLNGSSDFTVSFWYKKTSAVTTNILARWTNPLVDYYLTINYTGTATFYKYFNQAYSPPNPPVQSLTTLYAYNFPIQSSEWAHVIMYLDTQNKEMGLLLNNQELTTKTYPSNWNPVDFGTDGWFCVGSYQSVNSNGLQIDEMGFWNRVLTSDEITNLYNNGNGIGYPG